MVFSAVLSSWSFFNEKYAKATFHLINFYATLFLLAIKITILQ